MEIVYTAMLTGTASEDLRKQLLSKTPKTISSLMTTTQIRIRIEDGMREFIMKNRGTSQKQYQDSYGGRADSNRFGGRDAKPRRWRRLWGVYLEICYVSKIRKSVGMISTLFSLVFAEMGVILTLLFRSPLRKLLIVGIDQLKRGRGPLVAKTVAATLLVVFSAVLYSVMEIRRRSMESGVMNSTDEVLMAQRLLEASLMGLTFFKSDKEFVILTKYQIISSRIGELCAPRTN
ncbi:bcr-associated protein, bap, putative [Ricinus communis]|uniref:Endoplasmic reticulum transmembrane protein n=1 Tax=Ricinus communis TaxID=3988 RepID=B9SVA3_RICCO|nr:bcr-associated protein, bap, putative [Ricinus communis]